ncbi:MULTISPECIES: ABC transporter ATP-binding protein [Pontibacillus]|uniref:ABC transporter ATP-binding protein n=1 Tax=Pontibacillus chungwhensis TaxID=265426 RepID=A0ABY8V1K8_9BACI|nr:MULTISPECIES: ABC transporter ATP-binding protein [Pontibacillus]MCD5322344.1 ABC transporter ATP-binding protein [Pontibacillus sp. HN14]WIF99634.1 ABC transporter ATP-binding protein [Pontibacillus chungwhensis]
MNVDFQNVTKKFGSTTALDGVTVQFEENKIYGLLGKNGAGKTTLMQLLAGHILPTSGDVRIGGDSPFNNRDVLRNLCLINESSNFKRRLKVKDVLKVAAMFYPSWSHETADRLLQTFSLRTNQSTKGLSKGMESALGIIIGLASRAKVTIFDEPYIGLDASARYMFYDVLLEEYEEYPRTIILSTHLIDEVSQLFEEVIVLKDGRVLLQQPAENMVQKSIKVSGKSSVVDEFAKGKQVIEEKSMMGMKTAILYGEYISLDEAKSLGLEAERSTIQDVMVHLTNMEGGKAYA